MSPSASTPPKGSPRPPWKEFAQAPLVPVAIAATVGLATDRYLVGSIPVGLLIATGCALAWFRRPIPWLLWLAVAGLSNAYHHAHRTEFPRDDIGQSAQSGMRVVKVRGTILEDPQSRKASLNDPLQPRNRKVYDSSIMDCTAVSAEANTWVPASGRLRLRVERDADATEPLSGCKPGDLIEVVGQLTQAQAPGNPGERDLRERDLDQRIRGDLRSQGSGGLTRLDGGEFGVTRSLVWIRRHAVQSLQLNVGAEQVPVARALLLGDGTAMERREWDNYIRTGVVHVLAISGQHLVLLAAFAWIVLGISGIPYRKAAWIVMALVFAYAMLTGLRPSAFRAAIMVASVCGAVVLRRPVSAANAFAAAWLGVIALNPCDAFDLGGKLSFLSVFVLIWGVGRDRIPEPEDPIERLIDSTRPAWLRLLRAAVVAVGAAYLVNLVLFLVNTPLLMTEQNLASPVSLLIGPILVLLTSIALVAGFLLFLFAPIPGAGELLGGIVQWSLALTEALVGWAVEIPGGAIYLPGLPGVWLVGFYLLVAVVVLLGRGNRIRWAWALLGWIALGLVWPSSDRPGSGELRSTFLSVGHGGCTVLETDDGRCFLYDTGTVAGPDAVRRIVAPYLWHRGIRKVDELFLSHADADHFNGVPELLRRFPVGRITVTPSFADKPTVEVAEMLNAVKKSGVAMRVAFAGQRFEAGSVMFEVLHPPLEGPGTSENERSLVMVVRHTGHSFLFTGDLEKSGMDALLQRRATKVDVLQAPHHGSQAAFPVALARWAEPEFIVVSRGDLYSNFIRQGHAGSASPLWDTHESGAITLRSHPTGLSAESYRTKERIVIVRGGAP
jgi:competence protein ComEC